MTPKPNAVAMVFSVGFLLRGSNQCARILVCFFSMGPFTLLPFRVISTPSYSTDSDKFPSRITPKGHACRQMIGSDILSSEGLHRTLDSPPLQRYT